jgi:hypothetical protein
MRKTIIKIILILLALLVVWVAANQFDAKLNPDVFTKKDIPAASFDKTNGFYILWTWHEPPGVDVTSGPVLEKYRRLFDPQWDNETYIQQYDYKKEREMYRNSYLKKYQQLGIKLEGVRDSTHNDVCEEVESKRSSLSPLDPDLQVFYNRCRLMIESKVFEDFISLKADAPLPNLLAWLHATRLYTAVNVLTALDGEWEKGVSNLLDMVDFGKRAVKGSRFLIVNLVSKAVLKIPLEAVASLMNRKECPASVYEIVLKRTPPLEYEEYGSRQSLICELLAFSFDFIDHPYRTKPYRPLNFWERIPLFLFLQENRTKNYADEFFKKFIEMEETLPYRWKSDTVQLETFKAGPFWWLWNAGGKILLTTYNDYTGLHKKGSGLYAVIFKSYGKKAIYDMVRISAELHLKYDPDKPVQEILDGLDSYKVLDPCSGQPYKWNDEKQFLYSIGTDRTDNGGETQDYQKIPGTDYAIPVTLFLPHGMGNR